MVDWDVELAGHVERKEMLSKENGSLRELNK